MKNLCGRKNSKICKKDVTKDQRKYSLEKNYILIGFISDNGFSSFFILTYEEIYPHNYSSCISSHKNIILASECLFPVKRHLFFQNLIHLILTFFLNSKL